MRTFIGPWTANPAWSPAVTLWDTGSWQPRHRVPVGLAGNVRVPVAFSPDGTLLAAALDLERIHLLDAANAAPRAVLAPPLPIVAAHLTFSPDGRHLVATGVTSPVIHLGNLAALRSELRARGLDW